MSEDIIEEYIQEHIYESLDEEAFDKVIKENMDNDEGGKNGS